VAFNPMEEPIRVPPIWNHPGRIEAATPEALVSFSMIKTFRITGRWNAQFRAETFNALNHPNLYDPNTDPTSASWGTITGQDDPRSWQLSLKIVF
jgi:hypothetical protein